MGYKLPNKTNPSDVGNMCLQRGRKGGSKLSERTRVFLVIAGIVAIITTANLGVNLLFAQSHVFQTSGTGMAAAGMSPFGSISHHKHFLVAVAAVFLSAGILIALPASEKLAKPLLKVKEQNIRLHEMNKAVKSMSEARARAHANMRHEMRTPLNSVVRLSEHVLENEETQDGARDSLEKIHNAGITLLGIANNIFSFADKENGSFELMPVEYDVPSLINDIVTLNAMRIGDKPIKLNVQIDEALPRKLFGDDLRVELVCNNLLAGSLKFTKKGSIDFSLSCEKEGIHEWLTICISDTGVGFRPEELEELMCGASAGNSKSHGYTNGADCYSVTEAIVMMMGGTILAESAHGKGTSFTVRIPQGFVTDAPIGAEFVENLKKFQYCAGKVFGNAKLSRAKLPWARVLVVDDVDVNLDVAEELLRPYGMQVDCVASGWEAINLISEGKVEYDAIFMDQMMPDIDGVEVTRIIRENIGTKYAKNIPIIALTASAFNGAEKMFLEKGFQALLPKPIDAVKLDEIIHQWLWEKGTEKNALENLGALEAGALTLGAVGS
jgi:signal transduction histidine kinase/FixJ family two-component response regulator